MFEYEKVIQDLQDKGFTEAEIEEYIRREVDKDKNKKYEELDKAKYTFFIFLLGAVEVDTFKEEIEKIITKPNHDYSKVKKMIKNIESINNL